MGVQFTPLRQKVVSLLHTFNRPVGVYDLAHSCSDVMGRKIFAPSIYRTLQFWSDLRIVTHLPAHNTYMLVSTFPQQFARIVFVCAQCGSAMQYEGSTGSLVLLEAEPPRLFRRLQLLRGWSHEDSNEVFSRSA
jgi:Fe2+ or Zn2+ uptake regulation protein